MANETGTNFVINLNESFANNLLVFLKRAPCENGDEAEALTALRKHIHTQIVAQTPAEPKATAAS